LAETYKAAGKVNEAEAAYRKSISLRPNYWGGYNMLGTFYYKRARYSDAAQMFEKVVHLVPDNEQGYNNLGAMYEQMGRYEDAVQTFTQSIRRKPTGQGYSNLGTCYYFLGRYSDAAAAFEQAVTLRPRKYIYWANLGDSYRWVPDDDEKAARAYDEAITLARAELQVNPNDAGTRARLAECLAKRGQSAIAKSELARALSLDPTNVNIKYRAAVIANATGDPTAAISWIQKAISSGYQRAEIDRDPEFALLRSSDAYKKALQ
jgi:serine/threonine-protein kinase